MWYYTLIYFRQEGLIIRKVELTVNEQKKYEVIKKLVDEGGNKDRAALKLGVTRRHINRMIRGYKEQGKAYFCHGNRGRKPSNTIPEETRKLIVALYQTKYYDCNFAHFTEILAQYENIHISESSARLILESEYILSPRVTRAKHKRIKKELRAMKSNATTQKEKDEIQTNLVAVEDAHSRRPRCAYFGELEQMDASPYPWFGDKVTYLHIAVDDSTGALTGAWFDEQETLNGYYHVFHQILTRYGVPYKFFTDRRTIFTYKKKNSPSSDEDIYTQFAYACSQLGVELESSSVPQAKGRVERMFQTLQSRLPVEMRLAGITTINEANEFLKSYLLKFNEKFALPLKGITSVFEEQPPIEKINLILAVLTERTVDCGHCVQFRKKYYRMMDAFGTQVHYRKGTKVMLVEAFDGNKYCCVNDKDIYALDEVPRHEEKSENFDADYKKPETRKRTIPAMNHPWRRAAVQKFTKQQEHHWNDSKEQTA